MAAKTTTRFIGLQRKLATGIFLSLTIVLLALEYFSFTRNLNLQEQMLLQQISRIENLFHALTDRSATELFRIANHYDIPSADSDALNRLVEPSLLSGIASVAFFNAKGQLIVSSENIESLSEARQQRRHAMLRKAAEYHVPVSQIDCLESCIQSTVIPLIAANGEEVIANINRSLDIVIQDFYQLTFAEIALVKMHHHASNSNLMLASNAGQTRETALALLTKLEGESYPEKGLLSYLTGQYYSSKLFPLQNTAGNDIQVLIYRKHNEIREFITREIRETAIALALTLSFSMAAILLILRSPLRKILGLASLLRQLADTQFDVARQELSEIKKSGPWQDETDVLRDSLGHVIDDLDILSQNNVDQRKKLKQKISELIESQRFNTMLLDTSPLIIMIHDKSGEIHSINQLGRDLIGKSDDNKLNINDWVRSDVQQRRTSEALQLLFRDDDRHIQGEIPMFTSDGRRLEVLWVHRAINVQGQDRILSLGMDVTEQHEAIRSLQWLGRHDRVTGLLNRISFIDEVRSLSQQCGADERLDLVLLDIDDFAKFNDRFGFAAGDQLLLELARHVGLYLPEGSIIARSGSGEFSVLVRHSQAPDDREYRQLLEALTRYDIETVAGHEAIHISVVVNTVPADGSGGIDELLSDTTAIMTRIKRRARGQLFFSSDDLVDRLSRQEKYHMKDLLQKALDEKRLMLFYQPIIDIHLKKLSHCECLVRLLDDEGQFIPPIKFLGVASEMGLMTRIDFAVMEMAMYQLSRWQEQGVDLGLSINMTAHSMEQPDFEEKLKSLLARTGADASKLIFEVVETDALEDIGTANSLLKNFRAIGAKIALDDFGVGFTSFEYVRELPVDFIKIDQSFVRFIHERPSDQALVRSMVEMSHSLNKKVIVEGVENLDALNIVRDMGVEYIQGYYISRPVPLDALNLNMALEKLL